MHISMCMGINIHIRAYRCISGQRCLRHWLTTVHELRAGKCGLVGKQCWLAHLPGRSKACRRRWEEGEEAGQKRVGTECAVTHLCVLTGPGAEAVPAH